LRAWPSLENRQLFARSGNLLTQTPQRRIDTGPAGVPVWAKKDICGIDRPLFAPRSYLRFHCLGCESGRWARSDGRTREREGSVIVTQGCRPAPRLSRLDVGVTA
jgi:hypothetical protein